jgi:pyruvate/2-oxoglutarate dehydrogenase complex dihydrolipoamide dehydrogenase (E3) component
MADQLKPDLCIIGAGATGRRLAIKARERGLDVVLVDKGPEPGDAPHRAVQRAFWREAAERLHSIRTADRLGLPASQPAPSFRAIAEGARLRADHAVVEDRDERLEALGVRIIAEAAPAFADRQVLRAGDQAIRARHYVLAGGGTFRPPAIARLDEVPFFTPHSILDNTRKLTHLVVIGGDADALELAQVHVRLGCAVTLVPGGEMLPGFDREAVAILLRSLVAEGLVVREGEAVSAIVPRSQGIGVTVRTGDGAETALDASHILVSAGVVPSFDPALLANARVAFDPADGARLVLDDRGRTSNTRITALGGAGGDSDAHAIGWHEEVLLESLTGRGGMRRNDPGFARLVLTDPPLAQLGPDQALRNGETVLRQGLGETELGQVLADPVGGARLVVDRKGTISRAVLLGRGAPEVAASLGLMLGKGVTPGDLARLQPPPGSALEMLTLIGRRERGGQRPGGLLRRGGA